MPTGFSLHPERHRQPGPVRILLVEDDPLQQDILTTVFAL